MISETKIDDSYATNQFIIQRYAAPLRLDRNSRGGGILIYVREDIPCKEFKCQKHSKDIECIYFEINLRNNKWFLMGGYKPHKDTISQFLDDVSKKLDIHMKHDANMILLGDFNSEMYENAMIEFCETYCLQNLIKEPTCFKNPDNPSCIDVIFSVIETGLSEHHKMVFTVLKTDFKKLHPKGIIP